ncbi:MAG: hypothetical protein ACRDRJ_00345 [Streptosporangiaceae bacterium]
MTEREELRAQLRAEPAPALAIVVLRGGPDTVSLLRTHARRTQRLYCLDGAPLRGISVFGALDGEGTASRDGLLAGRLVTYPVVHAATVGSLVAAGFEVLATFRRPHFTIRLRTDSDAEASRLLQALGTAQENPYNGEVQRRRGPRPL